MKSGENPRMLLIIDRAVSKERAPLQSCWQRPLF